MSNSAELQAYVKAAKEKGATDEFLVAMLRDKGWPAKDVYAVFAERYAEQTGKVLPEPPGRLEAARSVLSSARVCDTGDVDLFYWFNLV